MGALEERTLRVPRRQGSHQPRCMLQHVRGEVCALNQADTGKRGRPSQASSEAKLGVARQGPKVLDTEEREKNQHC